MRTARARKSQTRLLHQVVQKLLEIRLASPRVIARIRAQPKSTESAAKYLRVETENIQKGEEVVERVRGSGAVPLLLLRSGCVR